MINNILTIDGPSGVGKGTVARIIAQKLGRDLLDSGAIYRALALAALNNNISLDNEQDLVLLARDLDLRFEAQTGQELLSVYLDAKDVSVQLRSQNCSQVASQIAKLANVREALLLRQRDFASDKGLVADGRDMGTVVFPDAQIKIFLTASSKERAKRRFLQLNNNQLHNNNNKGKIRNLLSNDKEFLVDLEKIELDIKDRDYRDTNRAVSPLKPADDAIIIDTTKLSIDGVVSAVLQEFK